MNTHTTRKYYYVSGPMPGRTEQAVKDKVNATWGPASYPKPGFQGRVSSRTIIQGFNQHKIPYLSHSGSQNKPVIQTVSEKFVLYSSTRLFS